MRELAELVGQGDVFVQSSQKNSTGYFYKGIPHTRVRVRSSYRSCRSVGGNGLKVLQNSQNVSGRVRCCTDLTKFVTSALVVNVMPVDCSVCSTGYGRKMSYGCRKCSEQDFVWPILFVIAIGLLALLFLCHMVSIERDNVSWRSFGRLKGVMPLQSFKIIIVSWQIATQVNI